MTEQSLEGHSDVTEPFWDAIENERLVVQYCNGCDEYIHYPRGRCPHCMADDLDYRPASGEATLVSYTTIHRTVHPRYQDDLPYVNAIVELSEGVRMMANLAVDSAEDLSIDMDLVVTFREHDDDRILPYFTPQ